MSGRAPFWRFAWVLIRESIASPRTTSIVSWDVDGKLTVERVES